MNNLSNVESLHPGPLGCEPTPPGEHYVDPRIIAKVATMYVGSTRWLDRPGTNQCNIFVADVLKEATAPPPQIGGNLGMLRYWLGFGKNPPTAGEWGDPSTFIPGWTVVAGGASWAQPGDIVAERINYTDASGHVGIVIGSSKTASADSTAKPAGKITVTNYGFRPGDSDPHHKDFGHVNNCVFRRRLNYCTPEQMHRLLRP